MVYNKISNYFTIFVAFRELQCSPFITFLNMLSYKFTFASSIYQFTYSHVFEFVHFYLR